MDRPFGGSSKADATGAILIAGPTASGKSALAMEMAERTHGVVINADSMQLYRELRLVTARPDANDEARVPHWLYGVVPAGEAFSTGAWLKLVAGALEEARGKGLRPILVGGTGLYFQALTQGFAQVPDIDPAIRAACRKLAEDGGADAVRAALRSCDAQAAEYLVDLQRLTRALEVVRSTGRRLAEWQSDRPGVPLLGPGAYASVVLAPPRPWLHDRIAQRAAQMLVPEGAAEVAGLLSQGLAETLPAMRAIGVREIGNWADGRLSRADAEHQLVVATRRYAKRQETFFRGQLGGWPRLDPSEGLSNTVIFQSFGLG